MKHRVRVDLFLNQEDDALAVINAIKEKKSKYVTINPSKDNEQDSFIEYHLCGHDENKPCQDSTYYWNKKAGLVADTKSIGS